jgi:hypothetical protein
MPRKTTNYFYDLHDRQIHGGEFGTTIGPENERDTIHNYFSGGRNPIISGGSYTTVVGNPGPSQRTLGFDLGTLGS